MKKIILFNELELYVTKENWDFLCKNRFFTDNPDTELIRAEFVSGTGIHEHKKDLWPIASQSFEAYIEDLREISGLDICSAAKQLVV